MLSLLLQNRTGNRGGTSLSIFRHLGAFGLFFLAILDSSPLPTFGGPDILLVILVSTRRNPWYEYAEHNPALTVSLPTPPRHPATARFLPRAPANHQPRREVTP